MACQTAGREGGRACCLNPPPKQCLSPDALLNPHFEEQVFVLTQTLFLITTRPPGSHLHVGGMGREGLR